ncbi:unnamed protein product [Sphagnum jensenii]
MLTAVLVCASGIAIALYYFIFFDIAAPGSDTINIGLLSDRQNGIILGMGLAIFGAVGAIALRFTLKNTDQTLSQERVFYKRSLVYAAFLVVVGFVVIGTHHLGATYVPRIQRSIARLFSAHSEAPNSLNKSEMIDKEAVHPATDNFATRAVDSGEDTSDHISPNRTDLGKSGAGHETTVSPPNSITVHQPEINEPLDEKTSSNMQLRKIQAELAIARRDVERLSEQAAREQAKSMETAQKNASLEEVNSKLSQYSTQLLGEVVEKRTKERAEAQVPIGIPLNVTQNVELPEVVWEDVREFYPKAYKNDIEQRLQRIALQTMQGRAPIDFTKADVHFTIEKDGRPTQIKITNVDGGIRGQRECAQFIEVAGPFRPLISQDLNSVQIDAKVVCDSDLVQVANVELQANQHRY